MNKHFERDLEKLQTLLQEQIARIRKNARIVLLMGGEGEGLVPDEVLDREEVILEEECLKISALHQPVARDLRFLTAVLKTNRDLERIGDLLEEINELTAKVPEVQKFLDEYDLDISRLYGQVEVAVSDACTSLNQEDADEARQVWGGNKEISESCNSVSEAVRDLLKKGPVKDQLLDALIAMRHLQRVADHAANIAKNVLYLDTGEIVRHRREEILGDTKPNAS